MNKMTGMFRFISALAFLMISFSVSAQFRDGAVYDDLYDGETVAALKAHVRELSASHLEGRKAGSEGEKAAAEYVTEVLKSYGVDVISPADGDVFGLKTESGDTLTSRNVTAFVQGYDKNLRNQYIVVGARLDNLGTMTVTVDGKPVEKVYCGANGNASGLAVLMELARMVQTNSIMFRRSVLFVAFGASSESFAGSWYFLNRSFSDVDKIDAMIPNSRLVWIARLVCSSSFAPKYREITTPPPMAIPLNNPITTKVRLLAILTAANASLEAKLPTTQASAIL